MQFRIIPVLLLSKQGMVKTRQFKDNIYLGDPINSVRILNDKYIEELIVLDIDAGKNKLGPDINKIKIIASECFSPVTYGGGLRNLDDIKNILKCGIEKFIFSSNIFFNKNLILEAIKYLGSQSVSLCIDYKKDIDENRIVYVNNGKINTNQLLEIYLDNIISLDIGEIILQSINNDGMSCGYDLEVIRNLSKKIKIPIISLGGSRNIDDMKKSYQAGASGAAAGSQFVFFKKKESILINYPYKEEIDKLFN
jgi:cyclase